MGIGRTMCAAGLSAVLLMGTITLAVAQDPEPAALAYVTRIVDGDTIYAMIGNRMEAIRYIGINTPEVYHQAIGYLPGGAAATDANHRLVDGRWVTLTFDTQPRDRHGRLLAYVWLDGQLVNAQLVHLGIARATPLLPNVRYWPYLADLERAAREAGRGVWAKSAGGPVVARAIRFKTEANEHTDTIVTSQPWPPTLPYPEDVAQRKRDQQLSGYAPPTR
jgi:micrococcal nuclease